ncbi:MULTISPECIES: hypothetical protein [unclassified Thalassospira]|mgnify:CR=1 FL=1|jgi:hypothetical protein|uniref:hypothetical protein n=1 Tax=unclassified Thalassospira TaxID=2648997 RepID=UPI000A1D6AD7|nr:hypothetical protein [Thalassospira sp. MCCC 1A01428]OSQ45104.1 hypothetical protein THS27_05360 [Thalassospira sp. MCCC 1A01428]
MQIGGYGATPVPNPVQIQQAAAPIAETGGNDLQAPPAQRVEQAAQAQEAQSKPLESTGRGQIVDITA